MSKLTLRLLAFIAVGVVVWIGAAFWAGRSLPSSDGARLAASEVSFKISLFTEPFSLDPLTMGHTASHYLFNNIYRGLLGYDANEGLQPEDAHCQWQEDDGGGLASYSCELRSDLAWSDGSPLKAEDYVRAFVRLINPETRTPHAEQLLALKNAREILAGEMSPSELGVRAETNHRLLFEFAEPDSDFPYRLAHPALSPLSASGYPEPEEAHLLLSNGPYRIQDWSRRAVIKLTSNPHYLRGNPKRPNVHFVFVEDDHTARRLYDHGRLHFLRRLPTTDIPLVRHRADFFQVPLARFDYIGFGPELGQLTELRQALSLSLNFPQLKALYHALGLPGCPGLPSAYMQEAHLGGRPCLEFQPEEAQKWLQRAQKIPPLQLHFSKMGGDDVARGMEWMQHQWKNNLGLDVELRPIEQGMLSQSLRHHPPSLFRRGVPLDRPTCLAALEIFYSTHPENLIRLDSPAYDRIIDDMRQAASPQDRQRLCSQGLKYLLTGYHLIPLGEIHFSMLISQDFMGIRLNELNQLDLKDLQGPKP